MLKLLLSITSLLAVGFHIEAQVLWADRVINFSSEYIEETEYKAVNKKYRAIQALGVPNVMPKGGSSPCAWSPATERSDSLEWIILGFDNPIKAQQIAIAESHNPGGITQVSVFDGRGHEKIIYEQAAPSAIQAASSWLRIFLETSDWLVSAVKISINTSAITGWSHIDAVGISESITPITTEINAIRQLESSNIEVVPLSFNSSADELFPVFSLHGQRLYFSRKYHPENTQDIDLDIWYSDRFGGDWQSPKKAAPVLNNQNHNYICAASNDDQLIFLADTYTDLFDFHSGIATSHWEEKKWSTPTRIEIENFRNYHPFFEFFVSNDQKIMILAIEMEDTFGGRDLYISQKISSGKWSTPVNLGPTINSADDEFSPYLAADGKTLYFTSLGFPGYGSADNYRSIRMSDDWNDWSTVENLGPIFNTAEWDASFTIDPSGNEAYFVSYANSIEGSADIFSTKLPLNLKPTPQILMVGKVLNAKTKKPIKADIIFDRIEDGKVANIVSANPENGAYEAILPATNQYGYWAKAKGYVSVSEFVDLTQFSDYTEIKKDFYLVPLETGQVVRLNNVFFDQSQFELLPGSFPELNRFAQTLLDNPQVEISLEGHTDLAGDPRLNMDLSKRRVEAVKSYLVAKGISEGRIETKAFGSTKPLTNDRTPDARRKNRRVEIRIKKM